MKELTIEQKAQRYDEALDCAKSALDCLADDYICNHLTKDDIRGMYAKLFPELNGSKDERIRKEIISLVQYTKGRRIGYEPRISQDDMLAWLEKHGEPVEINPTEFDTRLQALIGKFDSLPKEELIGSLSFWLNVVQNDGTYKPAKKQDEQTPIQDYNSIDPHFCKPVEHKPTDKIEPKFKVGDWVVNTVGDTNQVVKVLDDGYTLDDNTFLSNSWATEHYHLWTIQDAKDGDVLVDSLGNVCIYQEPSIKLMYHSYCYGNHKCFIDMGGSHGIVGSYPATKEQRDLLFQKMKEAGYEWDAEKLDLKKIED